MSATNDSNKSQKIIGGSSPFILTDIEVVHEPLASKSGEGIEHGFIDFGLSANDWHSIFNAIHKFFPLPIGKESCNDGGKMPEDLALLGKTSVWAGFGHKEREVIFDEQYRSEEHTSELQSQSNLA